MKIRIIQLFYLFVFCVNVQMSAQIGYQVSLLNSATGEPKVHTTVNAQVTLTNSLDEIILTENKSVTSNDFGVLSFTIGNENTLKEIDWNKLPFYISVKVDGVLIGKSQVLSVPVAEYAKQAGVVVTKELLMKGRWMWSEGREYDNEYRYITFTEDEYIYQAKVPYPEPNKDYITRGKYEIIGNNIYCYLNNEMYRSFGVYTYLPSQNILMNGQSIYVFSQP